MSGNNLEDTLDLVQEVANVWHRLGRCNGSMLYVPEAKYVKQEAQEVIEKLKDKVRELCNDLVVWRCFHCDEVFNDRGLAMAHFGPSLSSSPSCQIDVAGYRYMEENYNRHLEEDTDLHRALKALACTSAQAVRRAEEDGYAKGLKDARDQIFGG